MKPSADSLTILLLVRNAQSTLARDVDRLIDMAAELSLRFDLLIVDDGSRDATEEVAWELTTRYAQVLLVRQPQPLGMLAALREALQHTSGDYLLIHEGSSLPRIEELTSLWQSRLAGSRRGARPADWLSKKLRTVRDWWSASGDRAEQSRLRLLRRSEVELLDPAAGARPSAYLQRVRNRQTAVSR